MKILKLIGVYFLMVLVSLSAPALNVFGYSVNIKIEKV